MKLRLLQTLGKLRPRMPSLPFPRGGGGGDGEGDDEGAAPGPAITISVATAVVFGGIIIAVVGWAFFMGYIVGKGQNPEQRVEQMASSLGYGGSLTSPGGSASANSQGSGSMPDPGAAPDSGPAAGAIPPASGESAAPPQQPLPPVRTAPGEYPFLRPQGQGAWTGKVPSDKAAETANARKDSAKPDRKEKAESVFDHVFQMAAFKTKGEADSLARRLEGEGFRTTTAKDGKVFVVRVNLRGGPSDVDRLNETAASFRLGKPMLKSKKLVTQPAKKGRR
jgi:hypothetical protein